MTSYWISEADVAEAVIVKPLGSVYHLHYHWQAMASSWICFVCFNLTATAATKAAPLPLPSWDKVNLNWNKWVHITCTMSLNNKQRLNIRKKDLSSCIVKSFQEMTFELGDGFNTASLSKNLNVIHDIRVWVIKAWHYFGINVTSCSIGNRW